MLRVEDIRLAIGDLRLDRVAFEVAAGDYFMLLGASGAGKSALLEIIAGLRRPDAGRVWLAGRDITRLPIQRRNLGFVFQDNALFPHRSVGGNIAYGAPDPAAARAAADRTGVLGLWRRRPGTLSGGEAQRVALARALARRPPCLLLDEPLSSLDAQARADLRGLLRDLHRQGMTLLHVTHDPEEALALGARAAILENGRIVQTGPLRNLLDQPRSAFLARFAGLRNVLPGTLAAAADAGNLRRFACANEGPEFFILTDQPGGPGFLALRGEDVVLALTRPADSMRNVLAGRVADIEPARLGLHVLVEANGVCLWAHVTAEAAAEQALAPGAKVWLGFKATAARFIDTVFA